MVLAKRIILGFLLLLWWYGFFHPGFFVFVDGINLIFHEAGHVVFMPFGEIIYFLGGSVLQIVLPLGIAGCFYYKEQYFSASFTSLWAAESCVNVALYIKDARAQDIPLLNDNLTHDWNFLLGQAHWLKYDQGIGNGVIGLAFLVLGWGVWVGVTRIEDVKKEQVDY
ncbi:MAG: hypothetical protein WCP97_06275 [bacterium]